MLIMMKSSLQACMLQTDTGAFIPMSNSVMWMTTPWQLKPTTDCH
uniref:Uncharacterized protein n=1 Tax=Anguilla anguilla TaxID=7936 RepID=A0A0E9XXT4_ANGAN